MKHQKLDLLELDENITSIVFAAKKRLTGQVQDEIENVLFSASKKTFLECEVEYEETNDNYKKSLDIPTPQAMVDMGCSDNGYLELKYEDIKAYKGDCCIDPVSGMRCKNSYAGRMDLAHFTELCVPIKDRLYRLEMKTGREIPKHKDIQWLSNIIDCDFQTAEEFKIAFEKLNLDKNNIFKILFGYFEKKSKKKFEQNIGIQNTGKKHLKKYQKLAAAMEEFELPKIETSLYREDSEGNDIDEMWVNSLDPEVMEMNFKEDLPIDSNIFTFKRLSIPEESLSEEEIQEIKSANYDQYKNILNRYQEKKWKYCGKDSRNKNIFKPIGKKIDDVKIKTAISQAWSYLEETKLRFKSEKDKLISQTLDEGVSDDVYDGIEYFKLNKNKNIRSAKYRLTTCIYGGEWDGKKIKKATKGEALICWMVINGEL